MATKKGKEKMMGSRAKVVSSQRTDGDEWPSWGPLATGCGLAKDPP